MPSFWRTWGLPYEVFRKTAPAIRLERVTGTFGLGVVANQPHASHPDLDASNVKRLLFRSIRIRRKTEQNHLPE